MSFFLFYFFTPHEGKMNKRKKKHSIDLSLIGILRYTLRVGLNYIAIIAYLIGNYSPRCEM